MLTAATIFICAVATIAGGFMDAISGGGGILTLSALLLCGVPPHMALGTNKVGAFFGIVVSLIKFAKSHLVVWELVIYGIGFIIAGSFLGAFLALRLESEILGKVILALLPVAMLAIFLPPKKNTCKMIQISGIRLWVVLPVFCFCSGCYDGFFGPGGATFILLGLHWLLGLDLMRASATTKPLNLADNTCSAIYFVMSGAVFWELAIIMAICFMIGNWLGSTFAIHVGPKAIRRFLTISLLLVLLSLVWKYFIQ